MTPRGRLNEAYSFTNFVTGDSNRFAFEAARRVVALPGRVHNPLCIHGGVGVGKTHLATAIVLALRERLGVDDTRVLFPDDLLDDHAAPRDLLVRSSRGAKLLFVDDVQLLSRAPAAVNLLLRVLDVLLAGGGQVVLTCDLPPAAVPGLAVPLRSRFEAGLSAEILAPDGALRREIVARKAATCGHPVAPEVAAFIAESESGSVRALEGALNRARVYASSARVELSVGVARRALSHGEDEAGEASVSLDAIARAVGTAFGLSARALRSRKRRDRTSALARQVAMYLARRHSGRPLAEIWADYGWRDHSSAAHACAALRARLEDDPDLADRVSRLDSHFGGSPAGHSS